MKLKLVVVDLELSKRGKRVAAAALAPVLVIAGGAIAYASVPHTWKDGDTLSASDLNGNFGALDQRLATLEQAAITDAPCPPGYQQDTTATTFVLCKKGADETVKVGKGAGAFWIDRYEASVWQKPDGTGMQYGTAAAPDYPASFPQNGQRTPTFADLYALSKSGVAPSGNITWFQAQQACRAGGKRLPNGEEWLAAASGTNDPGASDGSGGACVTNAGGARQTGGGLTCVSAWGAEDMIGNVAEWTAEWYTGAGDGSAIVNFQVANWPSGYNGDATSNVQSYTYTAFTGTPATGVPAAANRGGYYTQGIVAGIFNLNVHHAPSDWYVGFGFRCVTPRG